MCAGVHTRAGPAKISIALLGSPHKDAAGEDVTEELRPLHHGVTPFRYLAGARSMLDPFGVGFSRTVVARGQSRP